MKILAIVVTYNGMPWLHRCLGSLCGEPAVEVVVIDNGSTDGTVEAIKEHFPQVRTVCTGNNLGFGQANNIGLRMALAEGADHAFLLNQDAWALPGTLQRLAEAAQTSPAFGVLSPMHLCGDGTALDRRFSEFIVPSACPGLYSDLCLGRLGPAPYPADFVNAAAWLITREALSTVGGFSPVFFHYGEDKNYIARLSHLGLQLGVVPDAWIHHDRAQRGPSVFFEDRERNLELYARLRFADPQYKRSPAGERWSLRRRMLACITSARYTELRTTWKEYKVVRRIDLEQAAVDRLRSQEIGPSFL